MNFFSISRTVIAVTLGSCLLGNSTSAHGGPGTSSDSGWLVLLSAPAAFLSRRFRRAIGITKTPDTYEVWFASNRAHYGNGLADQVSYGTCKVAIPKSHKIGYVGSSAFVRFWQRLFTGADDKLYVADTLELLPKGLVVFMRRAVQDGNQILVYIHGYNVSFEDAILRAAQIGFDLQVPGATAAFCWASRGKLDDYFADSDTIKLSEAHLAEFLSLLQDNFPSCQINILAHSMGNRALLGVLDDLAKYPALKDARFGQIFLAAPDIDARYFKRVADAYSLVSRRTTLYASRHDHALQTSRYIYDDPRVGYLPPITVVKGIDTIEVKGFELDFLGHSYYAEAYPVLFDMRELLKDDQAPSARHAITTAISDDGLAYWSLGNT